MVCLYQLSVLDMVFLGMFLKAVIGAVVASPRVVVAKVVGNGGGSDITKVTDNEDEELDDDV